MNVVVTGIGLLCCLGSLSESWQNLLARRSGIRLQRPFPELPAYPLGLIGKSPTQLTKLTRLVLSAALEDGRLTTPLPDCGVVIGSSRGCQAVWEQYASQLHGDRDSLQLENWLETLPNQGAIAAARQIGTTAIVLAPMAACATGIWAIAQAFELIQQGKCQRVIAGAIEAPVTPLTLAGFQQMGALAATGCYPFDKHREGLVLGEGAAILVLESAELALSRGAAIYGQILGFGLTCDATHISAPSIDNRSATIAVKDCLERSNLSATEIDYIHAHGTSTKLNDAREASLVQSLFPHGVAVSSTKGATGHTLGASGAIGAAFCLMALKRQEFPTCVGLKESEFQLNLVTAPRRGEIRQAMCFSFGFGGQNAVIALGKF
ncbi:MAG: beta-ketoacyl-ACP synthase [Hydrococcus sp. C42_A2020_068]|uniref:beta-ketoacyl-ACP synthase n=1 Tax=Pleurocapsa sp. PCC 7327 TaxID=118163 RepID=UPI00029FD5D0|nr:beta-ketoacyl-ACP synthase [Pleurocapsa sp. PCC 7327]AFY77145.1 3-oxoacyl-(acyl-carrier-protein) synthase [Pleurocapsa sp. PCC 7327]MBF2019353.1 beta-ketoacyl-ACP synthase [Hydrococcus sp. C42_A2020_068]